MLAEDSFLADLTDSLAVGVVLAQRSPYRVLWASRATADIMGIPYEEICRGAEAWLARIEPEGAERVRTYLDLVEREPGPHDFEFYIHPLEGPRRVVHVRSEPVFGSDGEYVRRIAIIDGAQHGGVRARAHADKVAFLAELSHEMRTPLSSMIGFAELLGDSDLDDRQERWVSLLQESGKLLVELLDTALSLARLEAPSGALRRERVSVGPLVQRCLDLLEPAAAERQIVFDVVRPDTEAVVALGDPERLQQVLLNVLTNALKFGPRGSRIAVVVTVDAHTVAIEVRDRGPGIERGQRERIFEPFERLDAGERGIAGSGLGLCVSRALMEAMGGSLRVVDTTEPGATFGVGLPLASDQLRFEAVPRAAHGDDPGLAAR